MDILPEESESGPRRVSDDTAVQGPRNNQHGDTDPQFDSHEPVLHWDMKPGPG
jgi:hypothetical protein